MKKAWEKGIIILGAVVLALFFCLGKKEEKVYTNGYQYLIGVSVPNVIEPWLNNFIDAFTEKAESDESINIIFRDAAGNSEKQLQDIRSLTECGIDLLIVSPNDSNSLAQVLQETFRKIPIILAGVGVQGEDYTCLIQADDEKIGRLAGEYILENLYEQNQRIVVFEGVEDSQVSKQRKEGFQNAIQGKIPETDITYYNGEWLRDRAELRIWSVTEAVSLPVSVRSVPENLLPAPHWKRLILHNPIGRNFLSLMNEHNHPMRPGRTVPKITMTLFLPDYCLQLLLFSRS